ncbi:MAG: HAMP domain-containing sensor histidine kinase [Bacteroidales bacterium]|nr:HAMP domain-containing sensor histidine kinase [Bacteroidales bacterium]
MQNKEISYILSEWSDEFNESLSKTNSLCVALFSVDKELLFATPVMKSLLKGEPSASLINPTFDKLLTIKSNKSLIFEGFLTIGDYYSINSSIVAHVFKKKDQLLIVGGADTAQLLDQYKSMQNLNQQINNLQRQLLKEKSTLENTLNQLNETNAELQQVNATKDKFFSIIAHDLRSPFNSIIGFSDLLVEQIKMKDIEGIDEYAQIIIESSNKAMDLLMNLMEWSRSQTGRMDFKPELLNIEHFVQEIIPLYDNIAEQKSITISHNLPHNISVLADKAMISTVFRNLIANAIKFTMSGGEITVSAIEQHNEILFSIRDTGVGISNDNLGKIFQLDQSCSTLGTSQEKGTGLGLILCKEFVEKHGGKIWVESEEGIGSTFYFTLPYKKEES